MLSVYNQNRQLAGILENADNVIERQRLNSVSTFRFTLPENDPKNELCTAFSYVNWDDGQLYRIMPQKETVSEIGSKTYECEHVIATLIDNVMFGQHVIGNIGTNTTAVLRWLLERQNLRFDPWTRVWTVDPLKRINWVLGDVEINRQFEYGWEQETILHALWSVVAPFTEPCRWEFDTDVFPFRIHLRRMPSDPADALHIKKGKNLVRLVKVSDPSLLCTRIYPLGQGEGVNQTNIRSVNNNVPFIQSPQSIISERGLIERVWIDRRYTDPESLRGAAASMLEALQEPHEEYEVDIAKLDDSRIYEAELGRLVDIEGFKRTWITGIDFFHDEIEESVLYVANKPRDIAGSIADLADRQRIEMAYAQGATQIFERDASGNCDTPTPLLLKIFIPAGLEIINHILLDVEMTRFRLPFAVTAGGGARTQTSSASSRNTTVSGGQSTQTSTAGGQSTQTSTANGSGSPQSTSGPSSTSTASSTHALATTMSALEAINTLYAGATGGSHRHGILSTALNHSHTVITNPHTHGIEHTHNVTVNIPNHQHNVSVPNHQHNVTIPNHSHGMDHTHTTTLPDHNHRLDPGMAWHNVQPARFDIIINGVVRQTVTAWEFQRDITDWMLNAQGRINRNAYYRIEIRPNAPAHVQMTLSVQGFIQSRGNRTV